MNHKEKIYEVIDEVQPARLCESSAAIKQYANDLRYGMEALSKLTPEKLHQIVIYISNYSKEDNSIESQFNKLFESWWTETCIYSGPNLCYNNENFKAIKKLGKVVLPYIDAKVNSEPQYKQRHIQWLKKGIEE